MTLEKPIRLADIPLRFGEDADQLVVQAMREMRRGISESIAESFRSLNGTWGAHQVRFAEILSDLDKSVREGEPDVRLLGRAGWTLPMWMPLQAIPKLLSVVGRDSPDLAQLDMAFAARYTKDDGKELKKLISDLTTEESLQPWRTLVEEAFLCYSEGRYQVVVPSLFVVIEGLTIAVANAPFEKSPVTPMRRMAQDRQSAIRLLVCVSLEEFLDSTFASSSFARTEPSSLNRHWTIHGRSRRPATQIDCIKLFNALHTLSHT